MARTASHGVSGGVWPGYVAAVAGLVQSLLFVSSVVATVVYLLGILGSQQQAPLPVATADGPSPQAVVAAAPPRERSPAPPGAQQVVGQTPSGPSQWAWSDEHLIPNAHKPLVLDYPVKQIEVDEQSRQRLSQALNEWVKAGSGQWRIVGHYLPAHEVSARRAYFRLQLLRNQLIDLGVDPRAIDLRVLPAAQGDRLGEHQVVVMAAPVASRGAP